MEPRRRRLFASLTLVFMLLIAAACGQKPGVAESGFGVAAGTGALPEGFQVTEEGNVVNTATGEVIDPETGEVVGTVETGTTTTGGTTTGGTTGGGPSTTGGGGGPSTGGSEPTGGDATGVTDKVIKIGVHAPLSGAAPVPSDSVDKGKDLYFRFMASNNNSLPGGRTIEVILKNDQYNPSAAVAVCKEMVQKDKVFLLSGAAGTDQIQACARYAQSVGVPYISAGVTEALVANFPTYFTTSMTYPDQGPLLVDYMINKLGAKEEKNGMVFFDTASFDDAHEEFKNAAADAGLPIAYDRKVSKNAGTSDARSVVQELQLAGIENVYVLTSPVFWIQLSKASNQQGYHPQWTGVGITMTFDTVGAAACADGPAADASKFFAPFPAWLDTNKYDPDFQKAVRQFHSDECGASGCGDDFMWLGWSGSKILWEMFEAVGENVTRERFMYIVERERGLKNGIGPVLSFTPEDHFGASQVHVSQLRCGGGVPRWFTIEDFVSDF